MKNLRSAVTYSPPKVGGVPRRGREYVLPRLAILLMRQFIRPRHYVTPPLS